MPSLTVNSQNITDWSGRKKSSHRTPGPTAGVYIPPGWTIGFSADNTVQRQWVDPVERAMILGKKTHLFFQCWRSRNLIIMAILDRRDHRTCQDPTVAENSAFVSNQPIRSVTAVSFGTRLSRCPQAVKRLWLLDTGKKA
ncbi:hypothetical protein I7I50_00539 [Histoplasma capsulatum G186AR]|nr:hypothetical protein I7I52_07807 [Histoplasma capsulatum]QSS72627.1 hypothetical protein I7I50_00539 [Histoplasma capsulatum G186AR]